MLPALYHAHHNRHLEDLPFWLSLAAQAGPPVLELGCGTGRILLPLEQAGFQAVGIDHDLDMLKYLSGMLAPGAASPWLVAADITTFNLALDFPLIILPCNTFTTLEERLRRACLACVHRHLAHKGLFAVCLPNPILLLNSPRRSPAVYEDEYILPQTGNPVQVSSAWRRTDQTFTLSWIYDHLLPDGRVERFMIESTHYILTPEQVIEEFGAARLQVLDMFSDYDRSPYRGDSPHLIVIAEA